VLLRAQPRGSRHAGVSRPSCNRYPRGRTPCPSIGQTCRSIPAVARGEPRSASRRFRAFECGGAGRARPRWRGSCSGAPFEWRIGPDAGSRGKAWRRAFDDGYAGRWTGAIGGRSWLTVPGGEVFLWGCAGGRRAIRHVTMKAVSRLATPSRIVSRSVSETSRGRRRKRPPLRTGRLGTRLTLSHRTVSPG
jgi:hypothetical protein